MFMLKKREKTLHAVKGGTCKLGKERNYIMFKCKNKGEENFKFSFMFCFWWTKIEISYRPKRKTKFLKIKFLKGKVEINL